MKINKIRAGINAKLLPQQLGKTLRESLEILGDEQVTGFVCDSSHLRQCLPSPAWMEVDGHGKHLQKVYKVFHLLRTTLDFLYNLQSI